MSSSTITTPFESEHNLPPRTVVRGIRPVTEEDLPQMMDLHRRAAGESVRGSDAFLRRVFFDAPWRSESLPSLGYEDENGRMIGVLGIMPRQMKFRGMNVLAAVGHHFIVDPSRRGTLAGVELARRFLRGPQDLSLAEGNRFSRTIWEFLGGTVCLLYTLCWTRALRPAQSALSDLRRRGLPNAAALTLNPACRAVDAALNLVPHRSFRRQTPAVLSEDLDPVTMLAYLSSFATDRALQPVYDVPSLDWLVETLSQRNHRGTLHKVAVRTASGRPLGWYLYYLGSSGIADVLQIGGRKETVAEVLDHLFYHAWQRGALAATGALDPSLCAALSESHCVFHRPDNCWTLIHSNDPQILNTIHSGDAFLSRLESEWWIAS